MPALEELGQYLVDQGLGSTLGDDVQIGLPPATPDNLISVMPTAGIPPVRTFGNAVGAPAVLRPSFQILVRNTDYLTARDNALSVWQVLDNLPEQTLQGTSASGTTSARYLHVTCDQSEPISLQPDDSDRFRFVVNISVHKETSA
jgi:hypothetical protein